MRFLIIIINEKKTTEEKTEHLMTHICFRHTTQTQSTDPLEYSRHPLHTRRRHALHSEPWFMISPNSMQHLEHDWLFPLVIVGWSSELLLFRIPLFLWLLSSARKNLLDFYFIFHTDKCSSAIVFMIIMLFVHIYSMILINIHYGDSDFE